LADEKLEDRTNQVNHNQLMNDINIIIEHINDKNPPQTNNKVKEETQQVKSFATWHIMLRTDENIYFRGINLVNIFRDLATLGSFQISRLDYLSSNSIDVWSIILSSDSSKDEIDSVFMFIDDNYSITRISKNNLFESPDKLNEPNNQEQSILDYIEHSGNNHEHNTTKSKPDVDEHATGKINKQSLKRISVDSEKLDNLMFLVSELITVNSQLNMYTNGPVYDSIRPYVEKVDNLSKQFRNAALGIRLVPLSDMILRFQRLIRDLSKHLNKKVELVTHGIDTELDKNTIDQLSDPLMHIIRNCIDHGIELPEVRKSKGKSETGQIKISACHSGNYIIIKVEDDGCGVNIEKIRAKAIEKGIIKTTDKPSVKELLDLIFLPGFSTAQNLTEVSGRGVGMDIVRKRILDLRGDVFVETEEGSGTSFTLRLQQSVTIIDTLLFRVEDCNFIVPVSEIKICSQVDIKDIESRRNTCTIPFDNLLIPFVDLRQKLHIGGQYNKKVKVIIIGSDNKYIALLTDKIVGEHQAVLKPLGKSFRDLDYLTSASQLGDGRLALMIDTNNIYKTTERASVN
jgi:two-component system chemotaxis sensor kinase CheA